MHNHECSQLLPFAVIVGVASAASAQLVDVQVVDGQVKMTSLKDGTVLVDPRGISLHDGGPLNVIDPEINVVKQDDGFDVVYTFTNNTNVPMPLGRLKLGVMPIGEDISYREFRWGGQELPADVNSWGGMSIRYPLSLYAPVHVISGDDYTIGISLQYPVLEYKHDVTFSMVSPGGNKALGPGGQGWALIMKMNNHGNESEDIAMPYPVSLDPGETNVYTLSVRATDDADDWMRTLVPYRDFFNETYGGVKYQRDPRAVYGFMAAVGDFMEPGNPEGWTSPYKMRPDEFGWQPRIDWMLERKGWDRMMMWMPGGAYEYDRDTAYDFVGNWVGDDNLMSATDPVHGLGQITDAGREMGLWWSQSVNYSESFGNLVGFDINNPVQVNTALAELDLAVATGATMIGLDTFTHKKCAMWDLYAWLDLMQKRHPHVTFVTEPLTMDFLHTLAPTHFTGHDDRHGLPENLEDIWMFYSPHYIADFLNPGHEIWGHYRYWAYDFYDVEVTPELIYEDMQKIADLGYVPTIFTGMELSLPHTFNAKETWYETVPQELLVFAPIKDPGGDDGGNDGDDDAGDGHADGGGDDGDKGDKGDEFDVKGVRTFVGGGGKGGDDKKQPKLPKHIGDDEVIRTLKRLPSDHALKSAGHESLPQSPRTPDADAERRISTPDASLASAAKASVGGSSAGRAGGAGGASGRASTGGRFAFTPNVRLSIEDVAQVEGVSSRSSTSTFVGSDRISTPGSFSAYRSAIRSSDEDRLRRRISIYGRNRFSSAWTAPVVRAADAKGDSDKE